MPPYSRERPLRVYAALCGPTVGVIAAAALAGWIYDFPLLRSFLPDQVAMNPATAICFLLSGLALWCVRSDDAGKKERLVAAACAGIVAILALVKLWGVATGKEVGFDQVPFADRLAGTATTPPNRMAPNTALNFLFVGASLTLLSRPGNACRRASHLLATPALLLAVFGLLGYAYGVQAFYGVTTYIPMALNTVVAFFLLSSAVLVSRPGAGIAPLLVADDGGGHLLRRLLPATFAILAISGWLELQGVSARLFEPRFGLTLVVALNLLVLATLGLASARRISRSDSALREARLLFDSNPQPMWVYDTESLAFLAVNQAAVRQYGYTEEEFRAMTLRDIRPPEDVPALLEEVGQPTTGPLRTREWRHCRKDGTLIDVQISADRLSFAGRPAKLVLATDITERKQIEAQFRQAQKLDAIGRLAGGVAHDFNNLLTVIMGQAQLLQVHLARKSPEAHRIEDILEAGQRATGLTRQLLAFSRKQVLAPVVIDLNAVIVDSVKMLKRLIGEDVDLMVVPARNLGHIKADPGQIDQIIMNLALNARDAMPEGGKITVETDDVELDETYRSQHPMMEAGPYVMLSISDTGCGMDAATQARIFEPFFTTKEIGKGTGLGLATVYGIVKQSGGFIWVYSEVGRGTTFKVYFPRIEAGSAAGPHRTGTQPHPAPSGNETVLVVEDDARVRVLVRDILASHGYTVLEAGNGNEAVLRAQEHPGPIHLILTDVIMPGQSGRELIDRLRPTRPEARVLFMSGYTDDAIVRHGIMNEGTAFLQKPFTTEHLLRKTRDALDGVRRAA